MGRPTTTEIRETEEDASEAVKVALIISGADKTRFRTAQKQASQQLPVGHRSIPQHLREGHVHPWKLSQHEDKQAVPRRQHQKRSCVHPARRERMRTWGLWGQSRTWQPGKRWNSRRQRRRYQFRHDRIGGSSKHGRDAKSEQGGGLALLQLRQNGPLGI